MERVSIAREELLQLARQRGLPADIQDYYVPKSNPLTAEKIELGRRLFFDRRLSADATVSCATCHDPQLGFADGKRAAIGVGGRLGTRNSPTILNVLFNPSQFWDGRADTLEDQAPQPLTNPLEMGNASVDEVIARLRADAEYACAFRRVFGGEPTAARFAQAIAAYERTLVAGDSPFDRFMAGETEAISEAARRGFALFRGRARCSRCHTFTEQMPFFTDFAYHNTGVAAGHPRFESLSTRVSGRERAECQRVDRCFGARRGRGRTRTDASELSGFRSRVVQNADAAQHSIDRAVFSRRQRRNARGCRAVLQRGRTTEPQPRMGSQCAQSDRRRAARSRCISRIAHRTDARNRRRRALGQKREITKQTKEYGTDENTQLFRNFRF
ncbi:MAG: cytochrome-c peroxidase, partial [Acidobacteria bacterium]|nr:cytochrome-c peroxidase [Acidobacteriota bacterium]